MFVPDLYRAPDDSWTAELIRRNPLALLTSNGGADGPYATHVPIIPDPEGAMAIGAGATLLGHMNRANPHWAALRTGDPVLAVFTGPHAYVTPTIYDITPAAPTWNFTAVHVRGTVTKMPDPEATLAVVRATVRAFEREFGSGWDMSASQGYFRQLLPGVGAYRIAVTAVESMFKLSQEQRPEVRERVRCAFAERECSRHRETARMMAELPESGR
ncbi:FMN-binding negative transcriptional regulator [Nocardia arthritidis]|uniref:FMN-binding negative transcriptional regulator n=1 Tax=Nocardia arthritidis TaxID=228602 RepID=A0A6G9YAD3_9NOCA|nr:FMN-binding negative transcriptional regulator [Nocardia arthritidis]QIS10003.1 FMN-binding negative transcriptional regulator [Nocardia arthritidis]